MKNYYIKQVANVGKQFTELKLNQAHTTSNEQKGKQKIGKEKAKNPALQGPSEFGRRERIRTSDPLVPNQLRYQAALLAEIFFFFMVRRGGLEPPRP